jgi:hypothetical protein
MASFDSSKDDGQGLSRQVEAVQKASADLSAAMARSRGCRLCLFLAAVLLIAYICWQFYSLGMSVQSTEYQNALVSTAQKRLAAKSDQYSKHLEMLVEKTKDPVYKAFEAQIKKDVPTFMKEMEKEKDTLAANVEKEFTERVNKYYEGLSKDQEKALEKEFPSIKDPATRERMVNNVDKAVQNLVKRYYVEDFRRQIEEMQATWESFPEASPPKAGDPPLMHEFITTLLQYLAIQLSRGGFMPKASA